MSGKSQWLALRFVHMGLSFGISFSVLSFLGYYGGNYLDQRWGTEPMLMILGIVLGGGLSFYSLIKEIMTYDRMDKNGRK